MGFIFGNEPTPEFAGRGYLDANLVSFTAIIAALGVLVLLAVGYALSALLPSQGAAQAIGNILVFPLIFLSGAAVPMEVLPPRVHQVAQFSPVTQLVELLQGLWQGQAWSEQWLPLAILTGLLTLAAMVAARLFRWEPSRRRQI